MNIANAATYVATVYCNATMRTSATYVNSLMQGVPRDAIVLLYRLLESATSFCCQRR